MTTPQAQHSANSQVSYESAVNGSVDYAQLPTHNTSQSGDCGVIQPSVAASPSCSSNHGDHIAKLTPGSPTTKCNEEHSNSASQDYSSFEHCDSNNSSACAPTEMV